MEQIGNDEVKLIFEGALAKTYALNSISGTKRFLKVQAAESYETIEAQKQKLEWIEDKLPVPRVLYYEKTTENEYMITEGIEGIDGKDGIEKFPEEMLPEIVSTIARGLKMLHSVPIDDCPYDNSLKIYMKIAEDSYRSGKVETAELIRKFGCGNIEEAYNELLQTSSEITEELVFTHGDFSMPNVMLQDGKITGFLDLGSCGIADIYADLAIAERSVIWNYGEKYVDLFYKAYGVNSPDRKKVRFYQLLECFVYA
jgi:kanamycin kinase/aminoglycoside 3'-phosphotransferase-2